jgi:hypothetical protein
MASAALLSLALLQRFVSKIESVNNAAPVLALVFLALAANAMALYRQHQSKNQSKAKKA